MFRYEPFTISSIVLSMFIQEDDILFYYIHWQRTPVRKTMKLPHKTNDRNEVELLMPFLIDLAKPFSHVSLGIIFDGSMNIYHLNLFWWMIAFLRVGWVALFWGSGSSRCYTMSWPIICCIIIESPSLSDIILCRELSCSFQVYWTSWCLHFGM